MRAPLKNISITVKLVALEKVSLNDAQNPKTVCEKIDTQWQARSA